MMRSRLSTPLFVCLLVALFFLAVVFFRQSVGEESGSADSGKSERGVKSSLARDASVGFRAPRAEDLDEFVELEASLRRGENNRLILEEAKVLEREVLEGTISREVVMKPLPHGVRGPLTVDEHTLSAIEASLDIAAVNDFLRSGAESLWLPIAAGQEVQVEVEKIITRGPQTNTLLGKVKGDPFSDVLIVFHDGAVSGSVAFFDTNTHYQYGLAGNGSVAIRHLDPASFTAPCGNPGEALGEGLGDGLGEDPGPSPAGGDDPENEPPPGSLVIDTVVGYGSEARLADGGVSAIEARIIASIDRMNDAFDNSAVGSPFISLLAMIEDPSYVFPGAISGQMGSSDELGDLNVHGDGFLDTVSQLRLDLGADHNAFVIKSVDGSAGIAYRPGRAMIVARNYMASTRITFSHEFGHSLGCRHSWGDGGSSNLTSVHNYGWRLDPPSGSRVRTIMAYDWSWGSGTRIPHFANPDIFYNGARTGAVDGANVSGDLTADQRYVSGGLDGGLGSGFNGSYANLGARNAHYITSNAWTTADNGSRSSLAVLEPAGAPLVGPGDSLAIFWHGGDHTDTAEITLYRGNFPQILIASGISGEDRWHSWTVPTGMPGATNYSIRVTLNGAASAQSAVFSMVSSLQVAIDSPSGQRVTLVSTDQNLVLEGTAAGGSGGSATVSWSKISGPGAVVFENDSVPDTEVTFGALGEYVLRLSASDSGFSDSMDLKVRVGAVTAPGDYSLRYDLDESSGSSAWDSSGNANHGFVTGASENHWRSAGVLGNALEIMGDPVAIDSSVAVAIDNTTGISASVWARLDTAATSNRHILRQNHGTGTGRSWLYVTSAGDLRSYLGGGATNGPVLNLGEWYHIALTGGGGKVRLYVDGQQVDSSNLSVEANTGLVRLAQQSSPVDLFQWLGALDDVRLYHRVLSASEVEALAAGNQGPVVDAGSDGVAMNGIGAVLGGIVTDDALPSSPPMITSEWTQTSGPGTATFLDAADPVGTVVFPVVGTYTLRHTATDQAAILYDEVEWTVSESDPAERWRYQYFSTTENAGDAADGHDFDGDNLVNLLERAFGSDPTEASSDAAPYAGLVDAVGAPGDDFVTLTYRRLVGGTTPTGNDYTVDGMKYSVEYSADLSPPWLDDVFTEIAVAPPVDGVEEATFRLDIPIDPSGVGFLRLQVEAE